MLPVDDILNNAIIYWHENFQQAVARPNDYPRPPRSRRMWFNVDGLPMMPVAQVENQELPKIQRQQPFRNLQARVPTNRLREIESGAQESVSVINYSATYSHVLTPMMADLIECFQSTIIDLCAFAPPAHLPNVETLKNTTEDRLDTTASVLVRLSQANEIILAIPSIPWEWRTYGGGKLQ